MNEEKKLHEIAAEEDELIILAKDPEEEDERGVSAPCW